MSAPRSAAPADGLAAALEALRRPLAFAARDGFAHLDRVVGLGASLRALCDRLLPHVEERHRAPLVAWARDLDRWDGRPTAERERLVARGMRLVATVGLDAPASSPAAAAPAPATSGSVAAPTDEHGRLAEPLLGLPGVGPRTAERLAARGLRTVGDVLYFVPRRFDDLRTLRAVGALVPGEVATTRARVVSSRVVFGRRRFLEARLEGDDGALLVGLWFHFRGGFKERLAPGARFLLTGKVGEGRSGGPTMVHPELAAVDDEEAPEAGAGIRARYPEVDGVPGRVVERLAQLAVERCAGAVPDGIPGAVAARLALPGQGEALRALHVVAPSTTPAALEALNAGDTPAHRRLAFDELFFLQLGLARRRGAMARDEAPACRVPPGALDALFAALPFAPTGAQRRAIDEVARDLARAHPMHRLLQGDVGSGKTLVAYAAAELAMQSGLQAAVMAPTEILAEQHARTLEPWARSTGRRLALLTASTPRAARESTLSLLAAGALDLLVGTHALLAERVGFFRLGLVVIDEQHRFGVAQRALLRDKGGAAAPHLLVMTATPIPRTLALTAYGDLDLTLLDELPPGRTPATTEVHTGARGRARAYAALRRAVDGGRQAYVVCPLIEESETVDVADAVATAARLEAELPGVRVGLVHGRLPTAERDDVMRRFRAGEVRLLVATSVIEVGVDVPTAEVMLVEGADRFGLAQLHQLRGRIGRGGGRSLCLLVTDGARGSDAARRLDVMAESGDGFRIAEEDLRIRGPGEVYGTRQAGMPRLRFADLARDLELLQLARREAFALLERDPDLARPEHATTRAVLDARWRDGELFGREAG